MQSLVLTLLTLLTLLVPLAAAVAADGLPPIQQILDELRALRERVQLLETNAANADKEIAMLRAERPRSSAGTTTSRRLEVSDGKVSDGKVSDGKVSDGKVPDGKVTTNVASAARAATLQLGQCSLTATSGVSTLELSDCELAPVTALNGTLSALGHDVSSLQNDVSSLNSRTYVEYASDGKVGIGVSVPGSKLDISAPGNDGLRVRTGPSAAHQLYVGNTGGSSAVGTLTDHSVSVITNGATRMHVSSSGSNAHVGIGTTSPTSTLHVAGLDGQSTPALTVTNGKDVVSIGDQLTSTPGVRMSDGGANDVFLMGWGLSFRVGIGSPGGAQMIINSAGDATFKGNVDATGGLSGPSLTTTGNSGTRTLEWSFSVDAPGGGVHKVLGSLSGWGTGTRAVASLDYNCIYGYAYTYLTGGSIIASTRRVSNNADWRAISSTSHTQGDTSYQPTLSWDKGDLKLNVGSWAGVMGVMRVTVRGASFARA